MLPSLSEYVSLPLSIPHYCYNPRYYTYLQCRPPQTLILGLPARPLCLSQRVGLHCLVNEPLPIWAYLSTDKPASPAEPFCTRLASFVKEKGENDHGAYDTTTIDRHYDHCGPQLPTE
ncbi:hypothetical protein VNO80_13379 [Phaseolus coccineus]|uniref:Uncharacterized protein n=1 Tax=Phaseolus coccineus TaxID=3886 RepID=A0AAN9RB78_PHACN